MARTTNRERLQTDDQRLIYDAAQVLAGGSVRNLGTLLGLRSQSALAHIMTGRTASLDTLVRDRLRHLLVRAVIVRDYDPHVPRPRMTQEEWVMRVADHVLVCPECLLRACITANTHERRLSDDAARNVAVATDATESKIAARCTFTDISQRED